MFMHQEEDSFETFISEGDGERPTEYRPSRTLVLVLGAILFSIGGFALGTVYNSSATAQVFSSIPFLGDGLDRTPHDDVDFGDFWAVWNALDSHYVGKGTTTPPTKEERILGAIEGLTRSFGDPYTEFMPPVKAEIFAADIAGNFEGVGMEIGIRGDILTVIAPLKGTPAERAGIRSGDKILTIDGHSTEGISTNEAVSRIRGEKGTPVVFTMLRENEILEIEVIRDRIDVPTIETEKVDDDIFVISLFSFTASSSNLFRNALQEYAQSGAGKLIIDLRGNPGGYLQAAVQIASHFLPEGKTVVTEQYGDKKKDIVHRSVGYGVMGSKESVVILIDKGSASASEILAGALRDHGIATLIGEQSFGKGSVQELISIRDAALKVTVARWLTPSGVSISDGGLKPDIESVFSPEAWEEGRDVVKERAIEFLKTGK